LPHARPYITLHKLIAQLPLFHYVCWRRLEFRVDVGVGGRLPWAAGFLAHARFLRRDGARMLVGWRKEAREEGGGRRHARNLPRRIPNTPRRHASNLKRHARNLPRRIPNTPSICPQ
jgi:hypothetical protein